MSSVTLRLLVATRSNGKFALVTRRIGSVRAFVVLDVTRPRQRVRQVFEQRVALDLELAPHGRGRGCCDTT